MIKIKQNERCWQKSLIKLIFVYAWLTKRFTKACSSNYASSSKKKSTGKFLLVLSSRFTNLSHSYDSIANRNDSSSYGKYQKSFIWHVRFTFGTWSKLHCYCKQIVFSFCLSFSARVKCLFTFRLNNKIKWYEVLLVLSCLKEFVVLRKLSFN